MPVLSMGGGEGAVTIGQSVSIHYYLAAEHGLMGSSILEAARILSVVEHVREMSAAYGALVPWGQEPGPGVTEMWLEGGADDAVGTADASRKVLSDICSSVSVDPCSDFPNSCSRSGTSPGGWAAWKRLWTMGALQWAERCL